VWEEEGLLTVTGGKLTTFRVLAHDALRRVRKRLDLPRRVSRRAPLLESPTVDRPENLDRDAWLRLLGRYGADALAPVSAADPGELTSISGTPFLWAELRWAATGEAVVHLDDLLLRRVRLGLLLPQGGLSLMDRIRSLVQPALGWDDRRWEREVGRYVRIWQEAYRAG
jgi:glycerol-3-phosphate dehydrogenase